MSQKLRDGMSRSQAWEAVRNHGVSAAQATTRIVLDDGSEFAVTWADWIGTKDGHMLRSAFYVDEQGVGRQYYSRGV